MSPRMLDASARTILERLSEDDLVLDVGGWAHPFPRADWVIDLMPHSTRGLYGYEYADASEERFSERTWVMRDICDREPWPFAHDQFDFAICSHTLEDVRDPVWVCAELQRVARAGYVEVPSRLEEQAANVQGPWVGWGHHRWFCDLTDSGIEFVFKHHTIHGSPEHQLAAGSAQALSPEERVLSLWWESSFEAHERVLMTAEELSEYLAGAVAGRPSSAEAAGDGIAAKLLRRIRPLPRADSETGS